MRRGASVGLVLLAACATLPTTAPDGGGDDAAPIDATTPDAPTDAAIPDVATLDGNAAETSTDDAATDASSEASCFVDASAADANVDLDASTSGWGATLGNQGQFWGAAVDSSGHVLLGGSAGPTSQMEFFLQEVDSSGTPMWAKKVGSGGSDKNHRAWAVAFDAAGSMYAAGVTDDALDVGGGAKGPGGFVVKYDASGNFVWEYGPFANTQFYAMRVRPNGNVVAVGSLQGSADFGGGSVSSVNASLDALLVEITTCGSFVRAHLWGDGNAQEVRAVAIDSAGDLVLGGRFDGDIDFGGGALTGPTSGFNVYDMFVAKLDSNAGYVAQLETGSAGDDSLASVDVNASGDIFVAGQVAGGDSVNLGGGDLTATGAYDVFVGKLDSSLGYVWGKHVGSSNSGNFVLGHAAAADPLGGVAVIGQYGGANIDFGLGALPAGQGPFIARFDANGTCTASWGGAPIASQSAAAYGGAYLAWPDFVVAGGASASFSAPSGTVGPGPFALRIAP